MWNYEDAKNALLDKNVNVSMPGLTRIRSALKVLGNPQNSLRIIHVVGTNGKGSTSWMIMNILKAAGLTVGQFNSPYITELTEYIHVNGVEISREAFAAYAERTFKVLRENDLKLTHFEIITVITILYFCDVMPDICVFEAGMGGAKDATNVFDNSLLTVLTNVSVDHSSFLGNTIEEIKAEKLGIAREGEAIIEADKLTEELARVTSVNVSFKTIAFDYEGVGRITLNTPAGYQIKNAVTAITATRKLAELLGVNVGNEAIIKGLSEFKLGARFEQIKDEPLIFVDGGHNPDCAINVAETLRTLEIKNITVVTGVMADKDYEAIYGAVDEFVSCYVVVDDGVPRALNSNDLASVLEKTGKKVIKAHSTKVAAALIKRLNPEFTLFMGTLYMTDAFKRAISECFNEETSRANYENAVNRLTLKSFFSDHYSLEDMAVLLKELGDPQEKLNVIHVAGTNGKGSTCSMMASVLREAGFKTGLYTSPYIKVFNERLRFNGENIDNDLLYAITDLIIAEQDKLGMNLNQFALVTLIAFVYYELIGAEVVVLETGLGGTFDPTNIVKKPLCTVITNIGLDHTAILGNTISEIAAVKAGIIKENVPLVLYPVTEEAEAVIRKQAEAKHADYFLVNESDITDTNNSLKAEACTSEELNSFEYKGKAYAVPLNGDFQQKNAAVAITALKLVLPELFKKYSDSLCDKNCEFKCENDAEVSELISKGLLKCSWPGRLEKLSENPLVYADGGHNPQCVESVTGWINTRYKGFKKIYVCGFMKDKDYETMLKTISENADYLALVPVKNNPRSLQEMELTEIAKGFNISKDVYSDLETAVQNVRRMSDGNTVIVCLGSIFQLDGVYKLF